MRLLQSTLEERNKFLAEQVQVLDDKLQKIEEDKKEAEKKENEKKIEKLESSLKEANERVEKMQQMQLAIASAAAPSTQTQPTVTPYGEASAARQEMEKKELRQIKLSQQAMEFTVHNLMQQLTLQNAAAIGGGRANPVNKRHIPFEASGYTPPERKNKKDDDAQDEDQESESNDEVDEETEEVLRRLLRKQKRVAAKKLFDTSVSLSPIVKAKAVTKRRPNA